VIAHEIAHHVQGQLGLNGCTLDECGDPGQSLAYELQADCLAGAWTQDAGSRGVITEKDLERVSTAVTTYFGDPPGTSQDDPDAHGSGEVRDLLFNTGFEDGLAACGVEV
jgi:predicted metalloprotease